MFHNKVSNSLSDGCLSDVARQRPSLANSAIHYQVQSIIFKKQNWSLSAACYLILVLLFCHFVYVDIPIEEGLVDVFAPPQTPFAVQQTPEVLHDAEIWFSSWSCEK